MIMNLKEAVEFCGIAQNEPIVIVIDDNEIVTTIQNVQNPENIFVFKTRPVIADFTYKCTKFYCKELKIKNVGYMNNKPFTFGASIYFDNTSAVCLFKSANKEFEMSRETIDPEIKECLKYITVKGLTNESY